MDLSFETLVRSDYTTSPIQDILNGSTNVLLGVSVAGAEALKSISIETVFDLAVSETFAAAVKIADASNNPKSSMFQFGKPSNDLVNASLAAGIKVNELAFQEIGLLSRIPADKVQAIKDGLAVRTVWDLANYPPYKNALRIVNAAYFPENLLPSDDPELDSARDLVPANGEYPIEKVQYETLVMDEIKTGTTPETRIDILSNRFSPIDLAALAGGDGGFKHVAFGALLTINQSWYSQGVALGQLLHSLALAPGESTRLAVIDWTRKTSGKQTENLQASDSISQDMAQDRSINEVAKATAFEAQAGFSGADTQSKSTQHAVSTAEEVSGPFGGFLGGPSFSSGTTDSSATSSTHTEGYSTSSGIRDVGSAMIQNVHDRTHQNAHSVRGQRASVVKEVSETEKEEISTRVIANYNHMHSLNVHYYEVVQIYKTRVQIAKVDKVIFIPFKLFDFEDDKLIRRFQSVLARAAPTYGVRETINNLDVVQLAPHTEGRFSALSGLSLSQAIQSKGSLLTGILTRPLIFNPNTFKFPIGINRPAITTPIRPVGPAADADGEVPAPPADTDGATAPLTARMSTMQLHLSLATNLWDTTQASRLSAMLGRSVFRNNSSAFFLPTDITIVDTAVSPGDANLKESVRLKNGQFVEEVGADRNVGMIELDKIVVRGGSATADVSAKVTLTLSRNGVVFPLELPAINVPKGNTQELTVVDAQSGAVSASLKQYLKDNATYFNLAILRSLNATQIAMLLSGYDVTVGDATVPVAQVVNPRPIRYVGNYLAFKMNMDLGDPTWAEWLNDHGISLSKFSENLVPMATGGTFAEAVLGRSNCAEKLDITRFWNWSDSPVPLQPTEIAAINPGSRAGVQDLKAGDFSSPIVNVMQPQQLPDPTGTAAIIQAVQNGNMFRDMSGLQAIIAANQAATQATQSGASTAGQQAGENMNNLLKANTERQRIAAEMVSNLAKTAASVYSGGLAGGGGGISKGNASQDGAKINYFDKTARLETIPEAKPTPTEGGAAPAPATPAKKAPNSVFSENPAALNSVFGDKKSKSEVVDRIINGGQTLPPLNGGSSRDPLEGGMSGGPSKPAEPPSLKERLLEIHVAYPDGSPMNVGWNMQLFQQITSDTRGTTLVGESDPGSTQDDSVRIKFQPLTGDLTFKINAQGYIIGGEDDGKYLGVELIFSIPSDKWNGREVNRLYLQPNVNAPVTVKSRDMHEAAVQVEADARAKASLAGGLEGKIPEGKLALIGKIIDIVVKASADIAGEVGIRVKGDARMQFENEREMVLTSIGKGMKIVSID